MKKYRVTLTAAERDELERLLARGKADVRKLKHAQILLKADQAEGGPAWTDERIVVALDVGIATVQRLRQRFVEEGLPAALSPYRIGKRLYLRIPIQSGQVFRCEAGHRSGMKPATIPS